MYIYLSTPGQSVPFYELTLAALLAAHDESMPLLAGINQANTARLGQLARMLVEISTPS